MYLDGNLQRIRELKSTKIQTGEAKELRTWQYGAAVSAGIGRQVQNADT